MNYQEALAEKQESEKEMAGGQPPLKIIIVPELTEDMKRFMESYNEDLYTDDLCKLYSSNDEYTVLITAD
ncbi:hypothetical protein M9991_12380 [Chryseobacterium gallinarum]|uniref:hypothetical protein n=1 Tax=Chryseobacterium gallinarum TaxID=1324352 RepID=UPI002024907D|nr:hypothetical protein [Chryseobacterium gallinarum]MCL8537661.1 hypothetical protein [Chryseobacterium gallinarum]